MSIITIKRGEWQLNVTLEKGAANTAFVRPVIVKIWKENSFSYLTFKTRPSPNGCGLILLANIDGNSLPGIGTEGSKLIIELLQTFFSMNQSLEYRDVGGISRVGAFLFAQGDNHLQNIRHRLLMEAGFTKIAEYNNAQHGKDYNQSLFLYTVK